MIATSAIHKNQQTITKSYGRRSISLAATPRRMVNLNKSDPSSESSSSPLTSRRNAIRTVVDKYAVLASSLSSSLAIVSSNPENSQAAITDEAGSYENTYPDSTDNRKTLGLDASSSSIITTPPSVVTDEFTITIPISQINGDGGGLGIQLTDVSFQSNRRVCVKSVRDDSPGDKLGIRKDWILVTVDGQSIERTDANGAALIVGKAIRTATAAASDDNSGNSSSLKLVFRDPTVFRSQIRNLDEGGIATTQIAPGGTVKAGESQEDQILSVSKLVYAKYCQRRAERGDLIEISYLGTVLETGDVFDGGAIKVNGKGIPGRGNDTTVYFVLGNQPRGQFPPSWDVGLDGICVGERRRLIVPPVLGFGTAGVPRRGIPPNATLQYDVTLISLNGMATP